MLTNRNILGSIDKSYEWNKFNVFSFKYMFLFFVIGLQMFSDLLRLGFTSGFTFIFPNAEELT